MDWSNYQEDLSKVAGSLVKDLREAVQDCDETLRDFPELTLQEYQDLAEHYAQRVNEAAGENPARYNLRQCKVTVDCLNRMIRCAKAAAFGREIFSAQEREDPETEFYTQYFQAAASDTCNPLMPDDEQETACWRSSIPIALYDQQGGWGFLIEVTLDWLGQDCPRGTCFVHPKSIFHGFDDTWHEALRTAQDLAGGFPFCYRFKLIETGLHESMKEKQGGGFFQRSFPLLKIMGPSAGAAIASALQLMKAGYPVASDVLVSGTIDSQGHVGHVDGWEGKIKAAHESGVIRAIVYAPEIYNPGGHTLELLEVTSLADTADLMNGRQEREYLKSLASPHFLSDDGLDYQLGLRLDELFIPPPLSLDRIYKSENLEEEEIADYTFTDSSTGPIDFTEWIELISTKMGIHLLEAPAGFGKSTLMKMAAFRMAQNTLSDPQLYSSVPVWVPSAIIRTCRSAEECVLRAANQLLQHQGPNLRQILERKLASGTVVLLIDGWDELNETEDAIALLKDLTTYSENISVVISLRTPSTSSVMAIAEEKTKQQDFSFKGTITSLQPLDQNQLQAFAEKYLAPKAVHQLQLTEIAGATQGSRLLAAIALYLIKSGMASHDLSDHRLFERYLLQALTRAKSTDPELDLKDLSIIVTESFLQNHKSRTIRKTVIQDFLAAAVPDRRKDTLVNAFLDPLLFAGVLTPNQVNNILDGYVFSHTKFFDYLAAKGIAAKLDDQVGKESPLPKDLKLCSTLPPIPTSAFLESASLLPGWHGVLLHLARLVKSPAIRIEWSRVLRWRLVDIARHFPRLLEYHYSSSLPSLPDVDQDGAFLNRLRRKARSLLNKVDKDDYALDLLDSFADAAVQVLAFDAERREAILQRLAYYNQSGLLLSKEERSYYHRKSGLLTWSLLTSFPSDTKKSSIAGYQDDRSWDRAPKSLANADESEIIELLEYLGEMIPKLDSLLESEKGLKRALKDTDRLASTLASDPDFCRDILDPLEAKQYWDREEDCLYRKRWAVIADRLRLSKQPEFQSLLFLSEAAAIKNLLNNDWPYPLQVMDATDVALITRAIAIARPTSPLVSVEARHAELDRRNEETARTFYRSLTEFIEEHGLIDWGVLEGTEQEELGKRITEILNLDKRIDEYGRGWNNPFAQQIDAKLFEYLGWENPTDLPMARHEFCPADKLGESKEAEPTRTDPSVYYPEVTIYGYDLDQLCGKGGVRLDCIHPRWDADVGPISVDNQYDHQRSMQNVYNKTWPPADLPDDDAIVEHLSDLHDYLSELNSIWEHGEAAAIPQILSALINLLQSKFWEVRNDAAATLIAIGPKAATPEVLDAILDLAQREGNPELTIGLLDGLHVNIIELTQAFERRANRSASLLTGPHSPLLKKVKEGKDYDR